MADEGASETTRALAVRSSRELSDSSAKRRSVRSSASKQWQPPEALAPEDVLAVIDAAASERDRLLLRVLWATGARISEALALRPMDVRRDSLVLLNLKNPSRPTKRVFLPAGQADLPGALLLWAKEHQLADSQPLFVSRKRASGGAPRAISRQQAWEIVRAAADRANIRVLALRASRYGQPGEPAPVHPHLLRHARVRQIVRVTKSLPITQKQAGWSRLQMAYLTVGDEEVRAAMELVSE
jgi:integrase/recombinase XerD